MILTHKGAISTVLEVDNVIAARYALVIEEVILLVSGFLPENTSQLPAYFSLCLS